MDTNLSICQVCQKEPAVYGDGLTWARCAKCELDYQRQNQTPAPENTPPRGQPSEGQKFEHKTIEGLVSIVLPVYMVNYPLFHYTGNCIGSIREHTDREKYELIVIDNGSPIKPPSMRSYYADKVVVHTENLGVTMAWNKGIRVSFGEYIVLLNNDTQVYDGWLETMKAAIDSGEADLVMAHPMYSNQEPFARATEAKAVLEGKKMFDSLERDFSCVMFKKSLYDEVGAFDEQFFNYAADSDFLRRMEQLGKKFKMVDKVAIHHVSDATGASINETPEIMNEDKAKYEEKWANVVSAPAIVENEEGEAVFAVEPINYQDPIIEKPDEEEEGWVRFIRSAETGDRVYLVEGNAIHWVKNPEVFAALDGKFEDVRELTKEEFAEYQKGEPLDMNNVQKYA